MILHLDLDCFFVSAHRAVDAALQGIPAAVGGRSNLTIFDKQNSTKVLNSSKGAFVGSVISSSSLSDKNYFLDENGKARGIVTTCSYEARAYGVRTAMSVSQALQLCPHIKMIKPHYSLYHQLSTDLFEFLQKKLPVVEQFSIDEFFANTHGYIKPNELFLFVKNLQDEILQHFKLPISIGVAPSKYMAKLATNFAKPYGIKMLQQEEIEVFIKNLPIQAFPGVGKNMTQRLHAFGIRKLGQVKHKKALFYAWKKPGKQLYHRICGDDNEKVIPNNSKRKSIGIGRSFDPIASRDEIKRRLLIMCRYVAFLTKKQQVNPQTFFLKIKYDYNSKAKKFINHNRLFSEFFFKQSIVELFEEIDIHPSHEIIQLNIAVSNFNEQAPKSFDMFKYEQDLKHSKLCSCMKELREKFGVDIIKHATEL
jgi:DNA polymerase-4